MEPREGLFCWGSSYSYVRLQCSPSTAVGVIYKSFLAVLWDFATVSFSFWPDTQWLTCRNIVLEIVLNEFSVCLLRFQAENYFSLFNVFIFFSRVRVQFRYYF